MRHFSSLKNRSLIRCLTQGSLRTLPTDAPGQLDVLGHDGNALCVDGAQVRVFKQTHEVGFSSFLKSQNSRALEAQIALEVLGDLTHKTLEGQLTDQKLGRLLVAADLTKGDGSRPVAVGLLHTTGGGSRFTGSLSSQLLARSLASSRLAGGLLGASHWILNLSLDIADLMRTGTEW